jgi:hypothetical protein
MNPIAQTFTDITLAFEDAHAHLLGTLHALHEASESHAQKHYELECARAMKLAEGIDGKNSEQREAILRLDLHTLYHALHQSECQLNAAKLEHDCARLEWDCLRYRLRALEAAAKLCEGKP